MTDYKILPLAMTQVEWNTYIEFCKDLLGYSPTRGLDDSGIKIENPVSYLATLSLDNKPLQNLRQGYITDRVFEHVSFSFISEMDVNDLVETISYLGLSILQSRTKKNYLVILTGNMKQWRSAIIIGCSLSRSFGVRVYLNKCYLFFERAGFKEVWSKYDKQTLSDTSFILKER